MAQITGQDSSLTIETLMLLVDRLYHPAKDDGIQQIWLSKSLRRRDEVRSGKVLTIPSDIALDQIKQAFP